MSIPNLNNIGEIKTGLIVEPEQIAGTSYGNVQTIPVQMMNSISAIISPESITVLPGRRIADLVREVDPNLYIDEDVEEILQNYVDDFVDRVLNGAGTIARHRGVRSIEVKDVNLFMNRNYNIQVSVAEELRPRKRSLMDESHKHRVKLIRKALKKY